MTLAGLIFFFSFEEENRFVECWKGKTNRQKERESRPFCDITTCSEAAQGTGQLLLFFTGTRQQIIYGSIAGN